LIKLMAKLSTGTVAPFTAHSHCCIYGAKVFQIIALFLQFFEYFPLGFIDFNLADPV